jgi:hypothetical protein
MKILGPAIDLLWPQMTLSVSAHVALKESGQIARDQGDDGGRDLGGWIHHPRCDTDPTGVESFGVSNVSRAPPATQAPETDRRVCPGSPDGVGD